MKEKRCTNCGSLGPFGKCTANKDGLKDQCKTCLHTAYKVWAKNNPEKCRATAKRHYKKNRTAVIVRVREWQRAHPDQVRENSRNWRNSHLEEARARFREWYKVNVTEELRARIRARASIWATNNPEKIRTYNQNRRAALANAEHTLTEKEWLEILEYFGYACGYCLQGDIPLEQEHLVPVSRGGGYTAENIIPACRRCNATKKDRSIFVMLSMTG